MHYNHHAIERIERAAGGRGGRDERLPLDLAAVMLDMIRAIENLETTVHDLLARVKTLEFSR